MAILTSCKMSIQDPIQGRLGKMISYIALKGFVETLVLRAESGGQGLKGRVLRAGSGGQGLKVRVWRAGSGGQGLAGWTSFSAVRSNKLQALLYIKLTRT